MVTVNDEKWLAPKPIHDAVFGLDVVNSPHRLLQSVVSGYVQDRFGVGDRMEFAFQAAVVAHRARNGARRSFDG